ncbi:signal transduction histidine kinase [Methanobacterium lacus]|uniref:Signal transduction histidine kinase n=1 Tax=Methanobacterium lacus (strain AL-21) TaxID=877455 RepID=F0T939_METLA|nr:histidine kinase dimerization/phosphoacceptor domain -containing protein [Methanobacterium lacus]ADZ08661.1 signal transduction histidine kinase [Methanobacterium lacus]
MPFNPDEHPDWNTLRDKIIGLGESSIQKSYYPELQKRLAELERFRSLLDETNDHIFLLNIPSGKFSDVNKSASERFGLNSKEVPITSIHDLVDKDEIEDFNELFNQLANKSQDRKTFYSMFLDSGGIKIPVEISASTVNFGDELYIVMVVRDITERKEAENKIKKSLEEKKVLLREIHHRVKNNMQIISSLLNLQTTYTNDENVVDILMESQNRVKSMAMIHEKLYQSTELARIDFRDYIYQLTMFLRQSYVYMNSSITIETEVDDIHLNIDTAVPCGLIINELVTNSIKHGFPNGMPGLIRVKLFESNGEYTLCVKDNGVGFPETIDFRNTDTLGLQLITNLVLQLDGTIDVIFDHGTEFKINFQPMEYIQRI